MRDREDGTKKKPASGAQRDAERTFYEGVPLLSECNRFLRHTRKSHFIYDPKYSVAFF